jgi:hypothetical protein
MISEKARIFFMVERDTLNVRFYGENFKLFCFIRSYQTRILQILQIPCRYFLQHLKVDNFLINLGYQITAGGNIAIK